MTTDAIELLDRAKKATGSDYKTAKALEVTPQRVSDWRHERQPIPVADVVLMAELAGLQPEEWAARAIVSQYEGTSKGDKLFRALGKALAVTGVALVSSGANATAIFSTVSEVPGYFIRCIEVLTDRRQHVRL